MDKRAKIFLCYAREDEEAVELLHEKLFKAGFKPWMDTKDLEAGEQRQLAISKAIKESDFFVVCLSVRSIHERDSWQNEIGEALDRAKEMLSSDIYLIPIRLNEKCEIPDSLNSFKGVDLFEDDGWAKLMSAMKEGWKRRAELPNNVSASAPQTDSSSISFKAMGYSEEEHNGTAEVIITTQKTLEQWNLDYQNLLKAELANFLKITTEGIRITMVEHGSVKITVKLPKASAATLLSAYENKKLGNLAAHIAGMRSLGDWRHEKHKVEFVGHDHTHKSKIKQLLDFLSSENLQKSIRVSGSFGIGKSRFIDHALKNKNDKDEKGKDKDDKVKLLAITNDKNKLPLILKQRADFIVTYGRAALSKNPLDTITTIIELIRDHDDIDSSVATILYIDPEIASSSPVVLSKIINENWSVSSRKLIVEWRGPTKKASQNDNQLRSGAKRAKKPASIYQTAFDTDAVEVSALDDGDADKLINSMLEGKFNSEREFLNEITREFRIFCGTHPILIKLICKFVCDAEVKFELFKPDLLTNIERTAFHFPGNRNECDHVIEPLVASISSELFDAEDWIKTQNKYHPVLDHNGLIYQDEVLNPRESVKGGNGKIIKFLERFYFYKEGKTGMSAPKVFISYGHDDSPEHNDRVLALADRLVGDGINCILDQYDYLMPEGWVRWVNRQIKTADFVLIACTENYYKRAMGEEQPGKGLGVKWESKLIYQYIYLDDSNNKRFIPILFAPEQKKYIPTPLQDAIHYFVNTAEGYEKLYRRLTNQPAITKPALGKLRALPPRERKRDFIKQPITESEFFGNEEKDIISLKLSLADLLAFIAGVPNDKSGDPQVVHDLINKLIIPTNAQTVTSELFANLQASLIREFEQIVNEYKDVVNDTTLDQYEIAKARTRIASRGCAFLKHKKVIIQDAILEYDRYLELFCMHSENVR